MERVLPRRTSVWGKESVFFLVLLSIVGAKGETYHSPHTLGVSAPHLYYTCPEGADVKLMCAQKGTLLHPSDVLKSAWLFTPHSDQRCSPEEGPRNISIKALRTNHTLPPGVRYGREDRDFWVALQNVKTSDQGRYCCVVLEINLESKQIHFVQKSHSHVVLHVTPRRNGVHNCTVWDPTPPGGSVPVALAIAACILALLSLPLILVLVYKQRENAHSRRRAQELVRMDSEAHGHENPVFLGGSPQPKTRTVSQIMTRQCSDTGRHLLSEPGTPFSPPAHGDVFFPAEETIPESPDFLQV